MEVNVVALNEESRSSLTLVEKVIQGECALMIRDSFQLGDVASDGLFVGHIISDSAVDVVLDWIDRDPTRRAVVSTRSGYSYAGTVDCLKSPRGFLRREFKHAQVGGLTHARTTVMVLGEGAANWYSLKGRTLIWKDPLLPSSNRRPP